jgi:hypothetical protein
MTRARHCHAVACVARVRPNAVFCDRHGPLVPRELARELVCAWTPGDPTERYRLALLRARAYVAAREGQHEAAQSLAREAAGVMP